MKQQFHGKDEKESPLKHHEDRFVFEMIRNM
jgi:hypothetical protein